MTARVLVVDDIAANIKLLEARLMAEYFQVLCASNGEEALDICNKSPVDIVLLDIMMPGMDGFEVCRRLKANPKTAHIPVVIVTALDQPSDRVTGLEAGADDFVTKPVNDLALTTRVKSLVRLKMVTDELRLRADAGSEMGIEQLLQSGSESVARKRGKVLMVDDRPSSYEKLVKTLAREHDVTVITDPQEALFSAAEDGYELVVMSTQLENFDALRLCSQIRSLSRTRMLPILLVANPNEEAMLIRAIDMGVNDYILRPVDKNELVARTRTQIKRSRYNESLRDSVQQTVEMAIKDGLTGLNNRRYFDSHLKSAFDKAQVNGRPLSLLMVDIDHFKQVNDDHGHDAGDDVLREFAKRISKNVRNPDMSCRYGGEEFVLLMPDTDIQLACVVAERVRREVAAHPFIIDGGTKQINITVSVGASCIDGPDDTREALLKRADEALYRAKHNGRNQVVSDAA